jgi:BASS family bile acid:Na+ symporter
LLFKALLAVLVLTPLIAVLLVKGVQPPAPVGAGILIAALSIGPVAALKNSKKRGVERDIAVGMNVLFLCMSVVFVPVAVFVVGLAFRRVLHVGAGEVANAIIPLQLAPLFAGLAVGRLAPRFVARIEQRFTQLTNAALGLLAVAIVVLLFDKLVGLGGRAWVLIATFAAMSMLVGHALGGPEPGTRNVLATFSALRFPALGLVISRVAESKEAIVVVLAYVLCSLAMVLVYLTLERAARSDEPVEPHAPPHGA